MASAAGAIDAAAAGAAGACAKAGNAIAPANNAAVNIETVRFISFSFFVRLASESSESLSSYCRAIQQNGPKPSKSGLFYPMRAAANTQSVGPMTALVYRRPPADPVN